MPIRDVATGRHGATAILSALHERLRTGQGQHVDVCLMDTPVSW